MFVERLLVEINKNIRQQVINDLKQFLIDEQGVSLVEVYFSGRGEPVCASDDGQTGYLEVPAIAVYFTEAEASYDDFDAEEWDAILNIEIMDLATNQLDDALDFIGEKVRQTISRYYTAANLLTGCNRAGFNYVREDGAPWGSLILSFNVQMETE